MWGRGQGIGGRDPYHEMRDEMVWGMDVGVCSHFPLPTSTHPGSYGGDGGGVWIGSSKFEMLGFGGKLLLATMAV